MTAPFERQARTRRGRYSLKIAGHRLLQLVISYVTGADRHIKRGPLLRCLLHHFLLAGGKPTPNARTADICFICSAPSRHEESTDASGPDPGRQPPAEASAAYAGSGTQNVDRSADCAHWAKESSLTPLWKTQAGCKARQSIGLRTQRQTQAAHLHAVLTGRRSPLGTA